MANLTQQEILNRSRKMDAYKKRGKQQQLFRARLKYEPRSELRRLCVKLAWWCRRGANEFLSRMVVIK